MVKHLMRPSMEDMKKQYLMLVDCFINIGHAGALLLQYMILRIFGMESSTLKPH